MAVAWDLSAFVAVSLHDLADAEAAVDRSIALAEQAGDEIARGFALSTQGDLLVEQGRDHELGAVAEEILQVARGTEAPEALELTGLRFLALAELHDGRPAAAGAVLAEAIPRWADAHLDLNVLDGLFIAAAVLTAARDLAVSGASGHVPDRATSVQLVHDLDRLAAADGIDPDTLPRMARERLAPLQSNTAPLVGFGTRPGIDKRSFRSALTQRVLNMLAELSPTTSSH